ncbi:hypothetical protein F0726_02938 [Acidithiobacillus caldus]|nr:hypothetical protein F0726_02938 [Acidithiobacillus caldus]
MVAAIGRSEKLGIFAGHGTSENFWSSVQTGLG